MTGADLGSRPLVSQWPLQPEVWVKQTGEKRKATGQPPPVVPEKPPAPLAARAFSARVMPLISR